MESSIKYTQVLDSRIADLSDKIEYGVEFGASENTAQLFNSNTSTSSLITFNITPPSESTAIDRHVLLRTTLDFTLLVGSAGNPFVNNAGNDYQNDNFNCLQYGVREAFQAFPVSQAMNTITMSFNNTSISVNMRDVLPGILHQMDKKELQMYQGMTPTYLDNYQSFADAVTASNNNPLGGYQLAGFDEYLMSRGVHPVSLGQGNANGAVRRYNNGAPGVYIDSDPIKRADGDYWEVDLRATFTEPLFVSPCVFGHARYNSSAFLGINRFNLTLNMGDLSRSWCTGIKDNGPSYGIRYRTDNGLTGWSDSVILMNFLNLPQTFSAPSKIVLPYLDMDRYETQAPNAGEIAPGQPKEFALNAVNLDKVPDKIIIYARRPNRTVRDPMAFVPPIRCNITFANGAGRLSSFEQQQLYQLSIDNGLQMNWYSFSGISNGSGGTPGINNPGFRAYNTTGGLLVIDPAKDLGLPGPYLANGSLGTYQLNVKLTLFNSYANAFRPEFVMIVVNSGIMTTVSGNSSLYSGLVNQAIAMQSLDSDRVSDKHLKRLIGGSMSDSIASALLHVPVARRSLRKLCSSVQKGSGRQSKLDALSM